MQVLNLLLLIVGVFSLPAQNGITVGFGKSDITGPIGEIDLMGYAKLGQQANGIHLRLQARAFIFGSAEKRVAYVSIDAGQTSHFVKDRVIKKLNNPAYTEDNVMISATHTHSGPSGYLENFLYVANVFGYIEEEREALAMGIADAIRKADVMFQSNQQFQLTVQTGNLEGASRNRSPTSYLANPVDERNQYDGDVDKLMTVLGIRDFNGNTQSFVSWFAVHGTSMNETFEYVSGDNKGYASHLWEVNNPGFVAAFSQSNAGDVSPNTMAPVCIDSGLPCDGSKTSCPDSQGVFHISKCIGFGPGGYDNFLSTKLIGQKQADGAKSILQSGAITVTSNQVDYRHVYVDMSTVKLNINGTQVQTCKPAMGQSFAAGTTDGPGVDGNYQGLGSGGAGLNFIANILQYVLAPGQKLPEATQELQACHAPKSVLLATGEYTIPYTWQPTKIPLQLFLIGRKFVIIGQPSEITTMAGRRLRKAVLNQLVQDGTVDSDAHIVIAGLSNIYTSYVTTYEEYLQQRYEAGSTIFGPHTLEAYINQFSQLAHSFSTPNVNLNIAQADREGQYTELSLNDQLIHHVVTDGGPFGRVNQNVQSSYHIGDTVNVKFECAHPRNHGYFNKFAVVEQSVNGSWQTFISDGEWDIKFMWYRTGGALSATSECSVEWKIGETITTAPGQYRITTFGTSQNILGMKSPFEAMKRKILCLHGASSTPEGFRVLLSPTIEAFPNYDFVFVQAPLLDVYQGDNPKHQGKSMLYWMEYGEKLGFYHGFQEGFNVVRNAWNDTFDGMIGFSQGGVIIAACSTLVHPPPKFLVIYSAMFPKFLVPETDFYKLINSYKGPCLYISGEKETHLNIACPDIQNIEMITHPLGHVVHPEQQRLISWIESQTAKQSVSCISASVDVHLNSECKTFVKLVTREPLCQLALDAGKDIVLFSVKMTVLSRKEWDPVYTEYKPQIHGNTLEFDKVAAGTCIDLEIVFRTKLSGYGTDLIPFFKYAKADFQTRVFDGDLVYENKRHITGCLFDIPSEYKYTL
ncbi:hypothetical protein HDV04_001333 [Boothiomyces sp. JEL0838]|nr:hypothetical protein HDV04_001333 [Boothiomyces sp. JEL0838]